MKTKIAALTVLLFAGAATAALAQQDRDRGESRGEARAEHPATQTPRIAPEFHPDRPAPAPAAQPRSEPAAPAPPERQAQPQHRFEGGRPDGWRGGEGRRGGGGTDAQPQTPAQPPRLITRPDVTPNGADRPSRGDGERGWQGRDGQSPGDRNRGDQARGGQNRGDQNRGDQNRDGQGRGGWDGQRRDGQDRGGQDRGGQDRGGQDRGGQDRGGDRGRWNGDRNNNDRHDGDRHDGNRNNGRWDDHGRPHWDHNRYPPIYRSSHRYRHAWRPPIGYYASSWAFGDILPVGWYEPEYRLYDWWTYDLPAPPPGFSWVRVGYDAILVDDFDGRVVQVVRLVFY